MNYLLMLIVSFLFITSAQAGFILEPFLGYKTGSIDYTVSNLGSANGEYKFSYTGVGYGARVGYGVPFLMAGVSYEKGSIEDKFESAPLTQTGGNEYDTTYTGAWLGIKLPMFRLWGTYYFDFEWEDTNGADVGDISSGSGMGLGLGYTGLPFVSLNLEYRMLTIDKDKDVSAGTETEYPSQYVSELDLSEIVLSVSVPFEL